MTQNFQLASPLSRAAVIDVTASVTWLSPAIPLHGVRVLPRIGIHTPRGTSRLHEHWTINEKRVCQFVVDDEVVNDAAPQQGAGGR